MGILSCPAVGTFIIWRAPYYIRFYLKKQEHEKKLRREKRDEKA